MLEELALLVEVFYRVVMVGAWALHELMEVAERAMLGLRARMISLATNAELAGRR